MFEKQSNEIIKVGQGWMELDVSTPKHPCATMTIDSSDWSMLKDKGIGRICLNNLGYPVTYVGGKVICVHKILIPDTQSVDHINHNRTDNRRKNLRGCTQQNNSFNNSVSKNNKSGVTGVHWDKRCKKWHVQISVDRKAIFLGRFADKSDAIRVRRDAENKHFGEFSSNATGMAVTCVQHR